MNAVSMVDLDHVSKIAPTPLDPSFAAVRVATLHQYITALVCHGHMHMLVGPMCQDFITLRNLPEVSYK